MKIEIIPTKGWLYDKCENMEQLYDKYYYPLLVENKELKKQLEEKNMLIKQCDLSVSNAMDCYCERTDCSGRIKDSKKYDSLVQKLKNQQQEFIKYLEDMLDDDNDIFSIIRVKDVLAKYKEIIGEK